MTQIVRVSLDNEMDLILAHKRTMKLAELCGLSLPAQTTFAIAVSEIARSAIGYGKKSYLLLKIETPRLNRKEIIATLYDLVDLSKTNSEAFSYAGRLMGDIQRNQDKSGWFEVQLKHDIPHSGLISPAKIETFIDYFKNEPPLSPYDEIRKKNIQLLELADKLKASENQYRLVTDTLPLLMFSVNPKGEIIYANKGLKDFMNDTKPGLQGPSWLSLVHPGDHKQMLSGWEATIKSNSTFQGEVRLKGKDAYIWHLVSIVPVKNEKDIINNWIGFFVDIELQKQIEETLKDNEELKRIKQAREKYQKELEEKVNELNTSNHQLEQFAYIASHDLQEPLRKIKTYSSLLKGVLELDEKPKHFLSKIISSSDRMSVLIQDVLDYSRLATDTYHFLPVDLNVTIQNVLQDYELMITEKGSEVIVSAMPTVNGLALQLGQLFTNLLSNALKFSGESSKITITSQKLSSEEVKERKFLESSIHYYHILFEDNGIGFEQRYAEKIFIIFQRLTDKSHPGTGIGLALCKRIVENHNGKIVAEGKLNKGAKFHIYLPAIE